MIIKMLLSSALGAFVLITVANSQQSRESQYSAHTTSADDAKALLAKAVAAVKVNQDDAIAKFDNPNGGFKDRDLYVFCGDLKSGLSLNGPLKGKDLKTAQDATGKMFGQEMLDKSNDGQIAVVDYMFPKPGTKTPVEKQAFIEGIGAIYCGVGYYK
jgi:signal transduction histidine kinase